MKKLVAGGLGFRSCREGLSLRYGMGLVMRLAALMLLAVASGPVSAQTFTTLLSFSGTTGQNPKGDLTLSGSNLYGMTYSGGTAGGNGTLFSIPETGGAATILSSFYYPGNGTPQGAYPTGSLTLSGSTLYGMTDRGGTDNYGTIFSVPITGGVPTTLLSFNNTNGQNPQGSLILNQSTLYGMTEYGGGGNGSGYGTVFSIAATGGTPTTLLSFSATNGGGFSPYGSLTLGGSTLYGMVSQGGKSFYGTVFSIAATGGTPTTLFSFSATTGQGPYGSLTLGESTLYGMTEGGGAYGEGTIFSMPVTGGTITTLLSFSGSNGGTPYGSLTLVGTTLYGMTKYGGDLSLNYGTGNGTVFSIATTGGNPTTLLSFSGTSGAYPGAFPYGSLTASSSATVALTSAVSATIISGGTASLGTTVKNAATSSTLYGMTSQGGTSNDGTAFSLTVSGANNLNYTLTAAVLSGNATLGSASGTVVPGSSQPSTVSATSTSLGVNTISLTASDPNSSNLSQTVTATLTVLDHSNASNSRRRRTAGKMGGEWAVVS